MTLDTAAQLRRTRIELADGRELLFYDLHADPAARRAAVDRRPLPPIEVASEIRHDPVLDEAVVIASHRQERTFLPPADSCPLCPTRPGRPTEIPAEDYEVVVFENRFPSLRGPSGRCEVVCFTSDHDALLSQLGPERLRQVVDVWADRTRELGAREEVAQVFCFENRGKEIGVTLDHPHGQIYAYPFVTPRAERQLASARRHRSEHGGCLFCRVLEDELADGRRVLATTGSWAAFVPEAARWPFEVHLYPRRHVPDLPALEGAEADELARILPEVLGPFDHLFESPAPYIASWQQAPTRSDRDLAHLHLEVVSSRRSATKLKYLAGSESGAGVFINDIRPERAAELLRAARRRGVEPATPA